MQESFPTDISIFTTIFSLCAILQPLHGFNNKSLKSILDIKPGQNSPYCLHNTICTMECLNQGNHQQGFHPEWEMNVRQERDGLTIELPRFRWRAKMQVWHMCDLSSSHDLLILLMRYICWKCRNLEISWMRDERSSSSHLRSFSDSIILLSFALSMDFSSVSYRPLSPISNKYAQKCSHATLQYPFPNLFVVFYLFCGRWHLCQHSTLLPHLVGTFTTYHITILSTEGGTERLFDKRSPFCLALEFVPAGLQACMLERLCFPKNTVALV